MISTGRGGASRQPSAERVRGRARRATIPALAALALCAAALSAFVPTRVEGKGPAAGIAMPRITMPRITALATPVPRPVTSLATLPPLYYQDGAAVYAVYADGSGRTTVATLPRTSTTLPQLLADGRLLYVNGPGVLVVDRYGRAYGLRVPDLNAGESVWSVSASPDGRTLAWQIVGRQDLNGYSTNAGSGRIALTGRFGGPGQTVFTAQAGSADGQLPVALGWRAASPNGSGGATLLLQDLYSKADVSAALLPNAARGLLEYDPSIQDIVDDYLPPLQSDIPAQRALAIAHDANWAVVGDLYRLTPSGEGPLARAIGALNMNTAAVIPLDNAAAYPTHGTITLLHRSKVGKRVVTRKTVVPLHLYQYFSHNAYVAPDDGRVLYTLLTVSYPPGARLPRVQWTTLVSMLDGRAHTPVMKDAQGVGWIGNRLAIVKRADGLYSVDVSTGASTKIVPGAATRFIGLR